MGILTNALNDLVEGVIGIGIGQADKWLTRMHERGQLAQAAQALDDRIAEHGAYMQQTTSGGKGVLPTWASDPSVFNNAYTGQIATYLANQEIQNNPDVLAAESQRKQRESQNQAYMDVTKKKIDQGYFGSDVIPTYGTGKQTFSAGDLDTRANTMMENKAKVQEKFKIAAENRALDNKLAYRQRAGIGQGGNGAGTGTAGLPTGALNWVDKMLAQEGEKYGTVSMNAMGGMSIQPNDAGLWVRQRTNEIWQAQPKKSKNILGALTQAKVEWESQQKQQSQAEEQRLNQMGRLGINAPVSQTQQPTALQNLPKPQPTTAPKTTPLPTALPNIGPAKTPGTATPSQPTVTAMQMTQAIASAKADGKSPDFIKQMIQSRGFDPKNFGY